MPDVICRPAILEKMKKENYPKEQQVVDTMVEKALLEIPQQTYSQHKCHYASILPKDCNILTKPSLRLMRRIIPPIRDPCGTI
jgi:hypothetical protein